MCLQHYVIRNYRKHNLIVGIVRAVFVACNEDNLLEGTLALTHSDNQPVYTYNVRVLSIIKNAHICMILVNIKDIRHY